jgi:hypothetical protein
MVIQGVGYVADKDAYAVWTSTFKTTFSLLSQLSVTNVFAVCGVIMHLFFTRHSDVGRMHGLVLSIMHVNIYRDNDIANICAALIIVNI